MAAARGSDSGSKLDEVNADEYVRCPVCLDYYDDPKLLPCAHVVCGKCLVQWLQANSCPTTCPLCRENITDEEMCRLPSTLSPEEIREALPTDKSMEALTDAHRQKMEPHMCWKCQQEATSFCLTCYRKLCKICRRKHAKSTNKRMAKAKEKREAAVAEAGGSLVGLDADHPNIPYVGPKKHHIELLANLKPQDICSQRGWLCSTHTVEDNPHDYYCKTHKKVMCFLCVKATHLHCNVTTAEEMMKKTKKTLSKQTERLERSRAFLEGEEKKITQKEKESIKKSEELQLEIDAMMDGIVQRLKQAKEKLHQDIVDSDTLPVEQKMLQQSSVLRTFKDSLSDIVCMDEAEEAVRRFQDYSNQTVKEVQEQTAAVFGRGSRRSRSGASNPHHHHHHHQQQRPQQRQFSSFNDSVSELHAISAELNSVVQGVTDRLGQNLLGPSTANNNSTDSASTSSISTSTTNTNRANTDAPSSRPAHSHQSRISDID